MRLAFLGFCFLISIDKSFEEESKIKCDDVQKLVVGTFFFWSKPNNAALSEVGLYLTTNKERDLTEIGPGKWEGLKKGGFDPAKRTFVIIHGYKSSGKKNWVLELKNKLLDLKDVNIMVVDWSKGANHWNYVVCARKTQFTSEELFKYLQEMKSEVTKLKKPLKEILWNHLYFIGHSLGAHISGQTAHLLKQDDFWQVERITGLDPAKPCFVDIDPTLKITKDDADFVDIIHTQVGRGGNYDALGLKESVGHIDFYIDGGITQPGCQSLFSTRFNEMICSHKLSYSYYTESVENSKNSGCKFTSYPWDGSYVQAQQDLAKKIAGEICQDCPLMGIDATKNDKYNKMLVIVSEESPYCQIKQEKIKNVIKVIRKLKGYFI